MTHDLPRYGCHVTEKHVMSKSFELVDIVAPGVVLNGESDFIDGERIRLPGDFYSVLQVC